MEWLHRRVGEIKKQDWPLPIETLHEVDKLLEREWLKSKTLMGQKRVAEMGVWFVGGFCTGLRGEEMLMIELAGTSNSRKFLDDEKLAHFELVILGRTKGKRLVEPSLEFPVLR
jgi:hypothetical protein